MTQFPWLTALIVLPLAGSGVVALTPQGSPRVRRYAMGFALGTAALAAVVASRFDFDGTGLQLVERYAWIPQFGVSYSVGVNGVSLALILLTIVLSPVVILASWRDVAARSERGLFALMLVLESVVIGVFAAADLFLFYVLFEVMLVPMYFLIGRYGGPERARAALRFLLYSLFGGLIMLAAVIALSVNVAERTGALTFDLPTLIRLVDSGALDLGPTTEVLLFAGFFLAFAIKAPLWPLHSWLPDAAAQATPGSAVLLVGVLDKVGTYGMLQLCLPLFPGAAKSVAPLIITLAVIAIIYGALLAIAQRDMMRLIAYTSISHFGFIVLGVFAMTLQSQTGATMYMVSHGFTTAALFLVAGFLTARGGSRLVADYGGVQKSAPVLSGVFLFAALAGLALPGLSSFVAEFLVLVGAFTVSKPAAVVSGLGIILAAVYLLWLYQRTMTGPARTGSVAIADLSQRERWVVAPLIAVIIGIGLFPQPTLDLIRPSILTDDAGAGTHQGEAAGSRQEGSPR